ncbi:hypothetical protein PsorP6_001625 [Peronosclerospora sorghi]|uniref:Uncharacterized protein n=1 Tax=Peronosclerospora sorghi TaxID=230839 RepID=A0ACC0WUQ2_9STRA|nr:hypothetical protein PsorP6_001625 [Peronosclerospora sorghi]
MNALRHIFPISTHLLSVWHIKKNVLGNCKNYFATAQDWNNCDANGISDAPSCFECCDLNSGPFINHSTLPMTCHLFSTKTSVIVLVQRRLFSTSTSTTTTGFDLPNDPSMLTCSLQPTFSR